jgi:hypothetical protein
MITTEEEGLDLDQGELIRQTEALVREQARLEGSKDAHAPARRQPGEDPASRRLDDAIHWTGVYDELVQFKRELLAAVEEKMRSSSREGVSAELAHDREVLRLELRRLELHYTFWRERVPAGERSPENT